MSKILQFKTEKEQRLEDFFKRVEEEIKEYNLDNMYIACKDRNTGEVVIGSFGLDVSTKMELIGHLQVDTMHNIIKENYVTP